MTVSSPPFSPVLLAGLMLENVPVAPVNFVFRKVAEKLEKNHPKAMERLKPIAGTRFLIVPTDLPFAIMLDIVPIGVEVSCTKDVDIETDVRIKGSFTALIEMLDGEVDGDALFFSREISVEGNTEALVTLRNALDSDDVNLMQEIISSLGVLKLPAEVAISGIGSIMDRVQHDMNVMSSAITSPFERHSESIASEISSLKDKVTSLEARVKKQEARITRLAKKDKA